MKSALLQAACATVLLTAMVAIGDQVTIQLTGVSDGTIENFTVYTDASQQMTGPTIVNGLAYTGLYNATVTTDGTTESWKTFCIDPIGDVGINTTWKANLLTSTDLANGNGVLYASSYTSELAPEKISEITKEKYSMISYIADKYYYNADPAITPATRSDVSLAFWEIARDYNGTDPSLNLSTGKFQSTGGNQFITNLLAEVLGYKDGTIDMAVYSPTDRPSQEFLAFKVPEPATIGMLLTGLLAVFGLRYSLRRKTI